MFSKYIIKPDASDEDVKQGFFFLTFFAGVFAFLFLFLTIKFSISYFENTRYSDQSAVTQGTLIERVRIPRNRQGPLYYLRYKYENKYARQRCSIDFETRLTPRNRACLETVDRIKVNEAAYRAAKIPSKIDVIYLPSAEESWSQVVGHAPRQTHSWVRALLCFLTSLIFGSFVIKALRLT